MASRRVSGPVGLCALMALAVAAVTANAALINVNFNGFTGGTPGPTQEVSTLVGPAGGLGTSWNQYAANSSSGTMVDSTGAPTTVTVTSNFTEGRYDGTGASLTMLRATLTDFSKGMASRTVTISGLQANGLYDIWLVSHRHQSAVAERQKGSWTAVNSTTSPATQLVDGTAGNLNGATFVAGVNYARFENVVASGTGQIVVNGKAAKLADGFDADYRLHLNGLQINAVGPVLPGPVDAGVSTVAAAPASVPADGTTTSTITVTLKDAAGLAVPGKEVALANTTGPGQSVIAPATNQITGASGAAIFTVRSSTAGNEVFTATDVTDTNLVITQTATVEFVEPVVTPTNDIFSVNLYAYGRQLAGDVWLQEAARQTVRLAADDAAGAPGWETTGWQNVLASIATTTITSTQGSTATFRLLDQRNSGPYYWTATRSSSSFGDPNASLLDGHSNGTYDPGDATLHSILVVSNIPFAAYDVVIYLGINGAQKEQGKGSIRINGGAEQRFTMLTTEPDGTLIEIADEQTVGNYLVFRGFSASTFTAEIRGDGFTHLGLAGIQIAKASRARETLEITDFAIDPATQQISLTWKSFPGDDYGVYWAEDLGDFAPSIHPQVPAHPTASVTTHGPFPSPRPDATQAFFRIGAPDRFPPTLVRTWGNNSTISITFSEAMANAVGTNTANFAVVKNGGDPVAVASAGFHPGRDTILLETATPLDLDATYTVTMSNLTDRAGRPLGDGTTANFRTWDDNPDGIKVFILVGQSNMVGRGAPENGTNAVPGAIGSLRYQAITDTTNYGHLLVDPSQPVTSAWLARSDVKVWWNRADIGGAASILKGNLSPTLNGASFGPEYGFGWAVGEHSTEPVLLIKSCWGGKSLFVDFRPPSAVVARGGDVGRYYLEVFQHVRQVLDNLGTQFPEWSGMGYQIAGFGWHQGWNDMLNAPPAEEYEANLTDLINDLRAEFGQPNLPVSIGATGHGGYAATGSQLTIINAQLAVADPVLHPEFAGTVFTSDTRPFWRASSVSPANDTSHWNNNGETLFLIGDAMGDGMVDLLGP